MIETKRTILRPMKQEDAEAVFNYRSDSKTNQFQGWIPKSAEDVNEFINKNPDEFNVPETWFQLVIIETISDKIIGDIGIHFSDERNLQCEIGCTLNKEYHKQGFASETLQAVIDYLFTRLEKHRIFASLDPKNESSVNLMKRLGFRKEAHFKQSLWLRGNWVDDLVYAMLQSEWK
ncbi:GNAT family N-acetyltransferase [Corallibacter sp.]|jgi:RimJ/RimL family protein N-acetyltransferase|uniref:GNAT family N-acetyltransferase n=1 Tax=Flavobacteriaceae TaxID=49546 RepID=UPI003A933C11